MFKQIPIYPKYEISNDGIVRNLKTKKILKQKDNGKYLSVGLYNESNQIVYHNTHRLVAISWIEIPYNYKNMQVAHNDGNSKNNLYTNLRWTSAKENTHDKYKHNSFNSPFGENHHNKKLNDILVMQLRKDIKVHGLNCKELSAKYSIPKLTIYDAVTGKTWKHLNEIESPANLAGTQYQKRFK